jgi:hypothetical protein
MSISDLRDKIGLDTGLGGPLPPGDQPTWLRKPSFMTGVKRLFSH